MMIKLSMKELSSIMNLIEGPLHGDLARKRNKIVQVLDPDFQALFTKRVEILESHADKDENGKAKIDKGNYVMSDENKEAAKKELEDFFNSEKEYDLPGLKLLLENPEKKMSIADGKVYNDIMTKLETK